MSLAAPPPVRRSADSDEYDFVVVSSGSAHPREMQRLTRWEPYDPALGVPSDSWYAWLQSIGISCAIMVRTAEAQYAIFREPWAEREA